MLPNNKDHKTTKTKHQSSYTRSQRIVALCGVLLLILLYIVTLISAVFTSPTTPALFKGSLFASFIIPIMIFCYIKISRLLSGR